MMMDARSLYLFIYYNVVRFLVDVRFLVYSHIKDI